MRKLLSILSSQFVENIQFSAHIAAYKGEDAAH